MSERDDEVCKSCGRPIREHRDEWGRWESCVESIMETVAFHAAYPALATPTDTTEGGRE